MINHNINENIMFPIFFSHHPIYGRASPSQSNPLLFMPLICINNNKIPVLNKINLFAKYNGFKRSHTMSKLSFNKNMYYCKIVKELMNMKCDAIHF